MKHDNGAPRTSATRFLEQHGIAHPSHFYAYEEHGGTKVPARELDVPEHAVVTLSRSAASIDYCDRLS